jgi:uncharacterized protein
MKKKFSSVKLGAISFTLLFGLLIQTVFSQSSTPFSLDTSPLPAPTGFVNDYAGVLDGATKQKLENQIKEFKQKTNPSVELAVAIVNTTGERPIFDYSLAVARGWGIGSKANDNPSALLFVAIQDRKYFTQVSRDLEDELPDGLAGSLQRQYLVPEFKKGNYSKGISDTIEAYIRTIEARRSGEPTANATPDNRDRVDKTIDGIPTSVCRGICIIGIIIFLIAIFSGGRKGGGRGGGGGSGGSGIVSALLWAILSGASSSGSSSSSGGWSDGGSSGGWGGFGGGGDFGGGGAGGDW